MQKKNDKIFKQASSNSQSNPLFLNTLSSSSKIGKRLHEYDWSQMALGPIAHWPQSLKTSLSIILHSQHPMWLGWGSELIFFYNDAYLSVLGSAKHSWALGQPAAKVWAEIWDVCGPLTEKVFKEGEAIVINSVRLFINRGNLLEETFYSFSYSPIHDEGGKVRGLFCSSTEITEKLLSERRLKTVGELAARALVETTVETASASVMEVLSKNRDDIPFALLYLLTPDSKAAVLTQLIVVSKGLAGISPVVIEFDKLEQIASIWPIAKVLSSAQTEVVSVDSIETLPLGLADQRISQALLLALTSRGQDKIAGLLIIGVNPCHQLDTEYRTFYELVAAQMGIAIQSAKAYEEEKTRTQERQQAYDSLQREIEERIAVEKRLTEEQTRTQLVENDRQKQVDFIDTLCHELRNPLNGIYGCATLLKDSMQLLEQHVYRLLETNVNKEKEESIAHEKFQAIKEYLQAMLQGCKQQKVLVNDVLDFSKLEHNKIELNQVLFHLQQAVQQVTQIFMSDIQQKSLKLVLDLPPENIILKADVHRFQQIVTNLVSNAVKFTSQGFIEIAAKVETSTSSSSQLIVQVKDSGIGMSKEERSHLFERFNQAHPSIAKHYGGSGLGLAISKKLVEKMGGNIEVKSKKGHGSQFIFTLQCEVLTQAEMMQLKIKNKKSAENMLTMSPSLENSCILIVEDNFVNQKVLINYLKKLGGTTESVNHGLEAVQKCQQTQFDIILMDIEMPVMNGLEATRLIREYEKSLARHIPIIGLSGNGRKEQIQEALNSGMDAYLIKPVNLKELYQTIQTQFTQLKPFPGANIPKDDIALSSSPNTFFSRKWKEQEAQTTSSLLEETVVIHSKELKQ